MKLNGERKNLDQPVKAAELLTGEGFDLTRVAVMINGRIVPKSDLDETLVGEGDNLEVVSFVGGG